MDEFLGSAWIFLLHRVIQKNTVVSRGKVLVVKLPHGLFQCRQNRFRKGNGPVLLTLTVDREQHSVEVEIPHPQLLALEKSEATSEEKANEEPVRVRQFVEDGVNFLAGQHHWYIERLLRPRHPIQDPEFLFQGMSVQKEERVERLILSRSCDMTLNGQKGEIVLYIVS